ncbi:dynamin family protein [Bacteroides caccae]|uniref:Dynamin family protein n=1 Tax=Bacteroides caccae TaxID=47678 RepID=A0AAW7WMX7_9BACE|nr:dynamin family protein [Bacteroides caccae]MDO6328122.1 dynamin family protein [Bacteroides caccae]MDO6340303.1 dynamin family protein [Bacteroides caccae]MDO6357532.1 dynamin family protein [Bacteroides caccae]
METLNKHRHTILEKVNQLKGLLEDMRQSGIIEDCFAHKLVVSMSDVYINLTKPLIVTLIGPFSSGKTTFINAIIKERILPERIAPCTGMVCKIGYCDSHLKIQYLEGGIKIKKEITIEELKSFVDINDPSYRQREISDVLEIFHNNDFCAKDIVLVDTPGFNDPNFQDDATNMALEKADVVIYCMSAIHAYSKTDVEKIKELHRRKIDSIFYIVGFMDILRSNEINTGSSETDSFKNMITGSLAPQTILREDGVFFVSATDELNKIYKKPYILDDNGVENVRIKIWNYLQKNRLPIKIKNAHNSLNKISAELEKTIKIVLEKKQNSCIAFEKQILLKQKNRDDAQKCINAISQSCAEYEKEAYSFVKAQIEAEILGVIDNIDQWVNEVFDSSFIISPIGFHNDEMQKKINTIQSKCTARIQKAIEERIVPYINTSTNSLNRDIQHLVEKYIISVDIENSKIDAFGSLHLAVKENSLNSNMVSIPLIATLLVLEKSSVAITALAFNPIVGILATLGWGLFQRERKKKKIISCIKEQLRSYSLTSQYVQAIMSTIHWKEGADKTTSTLMNIIKEYDNEINRLRSENSELAADVKMITEFEKRRYDTFNTMNVQLTKS